MIQELSVFPQTHYSEHQGLVGTRKWVLDHNDNLIEFTRIICKSHWPGYPDSIPISVQTGAFFDNVVIRRDDVTNPRTIETLGGLAEYGKVLVVAQYALHKITNCWPDHIANTQKPMHPNGTTLSLRVRGGGQFLLVSPSGMKALSRLMECNPTINVEGLSPSIGTRIVLPVTEYQISCDRMTYKQVDRAMSYRHWDNYQGSVNTQIFLGAPPGTLLFDGYDISETHACDVDNPHRYCMTACLKRRVVSDIHGNPLKDGEPGRYVGWNHDYVNLVDPTNRKKQTWGWHFILMNEYKLDQQPRCVPRYSSLIFDWLFMPPPTVDQGCGQGDESSQTTLRDCDLCDYVPSETVSSSEPYIPSVMSESGQLEVPIESEPPHSSSALPPCPEDQRG